MSSKRPVARRANLDPVVGAEPMPRSQLDEQKLLGMRKLVQQFGAELPDN